MIAFIFYSGIFSRTDNSEAGNQIQSTESGEHLAYLQEHIQGVRQQQQQGYFMREDKAGVTPEQATPSLTQAQSRRTHAGH